MRSQLDALPIRLDAAGEHAEAIRSWAESVAGCQPVDAATATLVPPRLALTDVTAELDDRRTDPLPRVLFVTADDDALAAATAAAALSARVPGSVVTSWPTSVGTLAGVVGRTVPRDPVTEAQIVHLRVGGATGGVGTTTAALALAAILSWRVGPTLVVSHGTVPAPVGAAVDPVDLGGIGLWEVAAPLPGVRDLRIVRATAAPGDVPVSAQPARAVVRDVGTEEDVDVLVVRRDRAGVEAAARSIAAAIGVADTGPVPIEVLRRAAGGRRLVRLPWSVRVSRAGLARRVPGSLPGTWLRTVAGLLDAGGVADRRVRR
jgi:hypothetical protein